jgi:hypothetical protein
MIHKILEEINSAKDTFGAMCKKYTGSLTVEIIKNALSLSLPLNKIEISPRDVFIRGVPSEIDFLIAKKGAIAQNYLLYEPSDILWVFEIKNSGSFSKETISTIRNKFQKISNYNREIECFYLTLNELIKYKWAITEENLAFPSFTLFWHSMSGKNKKFEPTNDWEKLIEKITKRLENI